MNQLVLQGRQVSGWQVPPYSTLIQFSQTQPNRLMGVTIAGATPPAKSRFPRGT